VIGVKQAILVTLMLAVNLATVIRAKEQKICMVFVTSILGSVVSWEETVPSVLKTTS